MHRVQGLMGAVWLAMATACASAGGAGRDRGPVETGITVFVRDSLEIIRGKRAGLLSDSGAGGAWSVAHLLDANNRLSEVDATIVPFRAGQVPSDGALRTVDVVLIDLQSDGTRLGNTLELLGGTMIAAARAGRPVIVLDRPAPLNGSRTEGGVGAVASEGRHSSVDTVGGVYAVPLRHGMTTGELALLLHRRLEAGERPRVVRVRNWSREMWMDETRLPWSRMLPGVESIDALLMRAVMAPLEGSNVTVTRVGDGAYHSVGASWLDSRWAVLSMEELEPFGVRVRAARVHNEAGGGTLPGIRIEILDRDAVQVARLSAELLWALRRAGGDSLRLDMDRAAEVFGSEEVARLVMAGVHPEQIADRLVADAVIFRDRARAVFLY